MKINRSFPTLTNSFNNLNLRIIENGHLDSDNSWFHSDIISSYNRLYFIIEGNAYLKQGDKQYELNAGKVYLIPCNTQYTYACSSKIDKFYMHFELQVLPGLDIFNGINTFLERPFSLDLLSELVACASEDNPQNTIKLKALLYNLIFEFMDLFEVSQNLTGFLKQKELLEYIEKNLNSELKIQDIADYFSVPYHKISRNFKNDTGVGLKIYIEKMLLQKAKELLLCTDLNISEIANELKFCDAYYFSRFFRKFEEVPPNNYRKLRLQFSLN